MYGIKVPLGVDDYVWVLDDAASTPFEPRPVLFDCRDKAEKHREIWGPLAIVKRYDTELV
jgi:hypothetical protein